MRKLWKTVKENIILQLTVIVLVIIAVFFFLLIQNMNYFRKIEQENARNLSNLVLTQAGHSLNSYYDNLGSISESFGYSQAVLDYFSEKPLERITDIENIKSAFGNTILLNRHLDSVLLYDNNMNCIGALGNHYYLPERMKVLRAVEEFSADYYNKDSKNLCYAFYLPVYKLQSDEYMEQLGMCVFFLDSGALDDAIGNSLSAVGSAIELQDTAGRHLAFSATSDLTAVDSIDKLTTDKGFYATHGSWMKNSWRITVAISVEANSSEEQRYQRMLNYTLWIFVFMLALLVFYAYVKLARPIHTIGSFLEKVISEPGKRLSMKREDDIGIVADKLDLLLDENQKVIYEIRKSKILLYEVELSRQKMKLLAYRNQINPHFLYNTFACISGMALANDQDDIAEITMALSDIFRYAVKGGNIVCVEDEIRHMERYKKIIEYRFTGKISVEISAEKETYPVPLIKLILQPLVENAVFHGLEQKMEKGSVKINVSMQAARLVLAVTDDGCGIETDKLAQLKESYEQQVYEQGKAARVPEYMKPVNNVEGTGRDIVTAGESSTKQGIGIANIIQRLKLFYEADYTFTINSRKDVGTSIVITVPDHVREGITGD